ncbi:hypothetical protein [Clostridium sp.]|uniref:hypothetical protein n=1 Tax=Clostridium sp. TaxID=1506 RepID=UPI00262F45B8|nr:hypothetical protein [uncultured Clostridium sp.]
MHLIGLFKSRITVKKGKRLLADYCKLNGFEDNTTQWKKVTFAKHCFAYKINSHKRVARNWVSFHYMRENNKYSIWIDLVTEEITEVLRETV